MERNIPSYGAAIFLCYFVVVCQGQLSLVTLPDVLFADNNGVHSIKLGTVVQAHCIANSSSVPVVRWFKNGGGLLINAPPHMRIRTSTDSPVVTSVLTIDNYGLADDGDYTCEASDGTTTMSSITLRLDGINDDSIELLRNPVNFEIRAGTFSVKPYDLIRDNRTLYTPGEDFETDDFDDLCCQVFRCIAAIPGNQTAEADIDLLTVTWLKDGEEVVPLADRIVIINQLRYQEPPVDSTRYVSRLFLEPFESSNAGVYQCVYKDFDSDRELFFSSPFRLDSDDAAVGLQAISAVDIVLDPPEKLVIEVESSGAYFRHAWFKNNEELYPNGNPLFREDHPERFSAFFQVFVQDPTTTSDHGIYRVDLIDDTPEVLQTQEFTVTPLVTLRVDALNRTVTIVEGENANISCIASANPLPSDIVWTFDGNCTSFAQSDIIENITAYIPSEGEFSFTEGNITSTLHITAAAYPTDNGVYTCSSSTGTTTLSNTITVNVQVSPEVGVSSTSTGVILGQSVNITCNVLRSIPTNYTIVWTLTRISDGNVTTLTEDGETLVVTDITEDELGTYTCTTTNSADLSGSANITIGHLLEVTIADVDPALPGDSVTLNCSATGDTPFTYQWTMQGISDILNSDTSSGILVLTDIALTDFGTYICNVSNIFGSSTSDANLEQGAAPNITSPGENISIVEGETLEVMVTIEFNLVLDSITWEEDGVMLESGTDRVTIVNSDLDPPTVTSILTRTNISRSSDGGLYVVTAANRAGAVNTTFNVDVLYPPEVTVIATRTRLLVNQSTTLNCSVTSSNPSDVTVAWSLTNMSGVVAVLSVTEQTLIVSNIEEDEFGTYTCNVTNSAGLSETAEITIEQGALPEVTVADIDTAIPGENVTLNCSAATGNTPFTYQWTMQGISDILNNDTSSGVLVLTDIVLTDFGTYICNVSNIFGSSTSDINLEQGVAPNITSPGSNISVVEGEMLEVMVTIESNLVLDSITWEEDGIMLENGTDRVTIVNSDLDPPTATSILTRTNISRSSDGGLYVVTAANRAGAVNTTFNVDVLYPPEVTVIATRTRLLVNQSTTLNCSVTSSNPSDVTVAWSLTNMSGVVAVLSVTEQTLIVSNIEEDEFGAYTCNVTNSAGLSETAEITIEQGAIPEVTIADVELAIPGDNVTLNCSATGDTPFTYQWTMQGSSDILNSDTSDGILELMDIQESQFGTYICTVSNDLGVGENNVTIEQATVPVAGDDESVTFRVGDDLVLRAFFSNFNLVLDEIVWTQNSSLSLVDGVEGVSIANSDLSAPEATSTLTRPNIAGVSYAGTYVATASNRAGSSSMIFTVEITDAPVVTVQQTEYTFDQDSEGSLTCTATGIPPITIYWQYEGVNITDDLAVSITNNITLNDNVYLTTGRLTIISVQRSDDGWYTCVGTNGIRPDASDNATVTVNYPPSVVRPPVGVEAVYEDAVELTCTAEGLPRPDIMWLVEPYGGGSPVNIATNFTSMTQEVTITHTTSFLTLPSVNLQDTANYTCNATNRLGEDTERAVVQVLAGAEIIPEDSTTVRVNESDPIELLCRARGSPVPYFTWYIGEEEAQPNMVTSSAPSGEPPDYIYINSTLSITSVTPDDTANYTCIASNDIYGTQVNESQQHIVIVNYLPVIEVDPTAVNVLAPDPVSLTCTARGEPSPEIVWIKERNGTQTEYSESEEGVEINTETYTSMSTSTITIGFTDTFVTANYSCVAGNLIGDTTSRPAEVIIFVSPTVEVAQPLYLAIEFQVQELTCSATGVPGPSISFMRDGVILDRMGNMTSGGNLSERVNLLQPSRPILTRDGLYMVTRTLEILYPVGLDTGNYTCTASITVLNRTLSSVAQFHVVVQIAPVIDIPPADTVVVSPETATFFCEASGVLNPNITWRMNETTLEAGEDIAIMIDTGEITRNSTLTIPNTQPNDAATYTCVAVTAAGSVTASADLTVKFPPEITAPPLETVITVNEGMAAIFMCNATGVPGPNITWRRVEDSSNSSELNEEVDPRVSLGVPTTPSPVFTPNGTIFSVTRRLTLSNTTDSDSGFYLCHASNGEEPALTAILPFQLFVRVAPVITAVPEDSTELQGDTAMFTCNATARPRPNITWWRNSPDGTMIQITSEMDKITIETEPFGLEREQTSTLTVLDVQPSDAGIYLCRADNEAGRAEVTATLTVHVLPDIIFPPPSYQYEINQFTNVSLECNATGIPPPDILFFLNDNSTFNDRYSLLDPVTETIDISGQGDVVYLVTQRLSISPALDEDSNNYTCVATSENANDSVLFELIVMVAPNVTDAPDGQAVLENEDVLLSCVAEGRPPPTITWFKNTTDQIVTEVQQSEGVSIVTQSTGARQVVSNLTIESIQPRDAADYICNATNVAGSDTQAATLTVHVSPEIRFLQPPMLTINQSDTATFECNATGIPAPVIQWFMNTQELTVAGSGEMMLNPDQLTSRIDISDLEVSDYLTPGGYVSSVTSVLTILSTLSTDSGNYNCIASNVVGRTMTPAQDEDTATLYVQVPPLVVAVVPDVIGNESMNLTLQFRIDNAEPRVLLSGLRWFYSDDISREGMMDDITNIANRTSQSRLVTSFSSDINSAYFNITVINIVQRRRDGEDTDEGRYFLQATNPAGVSTAFVDLEVYGPPLIISPPLNDFVIAGDTAVFECTALAYPVHQVEWTFINSDGDSTVIIRTSEGNNTKYAINSVTGASSFGQLMILDVQYSDRGYYTCRAINDVGTDSATASLTVHVPPIVEEISPSMMINISEPAIIACLITGFPRPTVTWWKGDNVLVDDYVRIRIFEFEVSSSGSGSGSSIDYFGSGLAGSGLAGSGLTGSGLIGSGSLDNLLRDTVFPDKIIQNLGELGLVSLLAFGSLERSDTGSYMCTATNSLPGGQTGIRMAESPPTTLTVLEVPDVAVSLRSHDTGARWVLLEWTPGFNGNSEILSLRIQQYSPGQNVRLIESKISSQQLTSYNVTREILPFIPYGFQVALCNAIGCSDFTDIVIVMTEQDAPDAAPIITESVSPTSTSIMVTWSPPSPEKRNGILTDYIIRYTNDVKLPKTMWQMTATPNTSITLTGLSIFTEYTVAVAATTEAGVGPDDSVTVRTLNDTCSEPFAVTFTDVSETTLTLIWRESSIPNGIIDGYSITYHVGEIADSNTVVSDTESVQLVNLEPFTNYTVTVTCVNAAGPGNSSTPVTTRTNSAPPAIPDNTIVDSLEQPDGRQFSVVFNKPDDSNGPISHYHAIAVIVPPDVTLSDPNTDFGSFQSIDNVYSSACGEVSEITAYIAAEFSSDKFQDDRLQFTFGDGDDPLNDRSRYSNGLLCYATNYAFFLRVYNDVSTNARRSVRQVNDRQYDSFRSSGYITYTTESEPTSGGDNAGTIAGVVVALVVLIIVVAIIPIVVIFIVMRRRTIVYKTTITEPVDFDTSYYQQNENVQLTEFKRPDDGGAVHREPIPAADFGTHVEHLHTNENCLFGEEYKCIQDQSPRHPVEACIHPDNKQRNRYANIQCFDQSRCVLRSVEGHEHDYINANFINGYNRNNEYIATQGPLPNTVIDFWRLTWDHNVCTIVMLTNLIEKMKVKCSQYWPDTDSQTYSNITVTFKSANTTADFVMRVFDMKKEGCDEVRQVHQFHYLSWPDFGVPRHATPLLYFLHRIRDIQRYSNPQPILIHCSAGVGRSGTLIALDVELQRAQKEGVVDPFNYTLQMREQRNHMIQTEAQYTFLHDAILEGMTSRGTEIPVDNLTGRMKELEQLDRDGDTGYHNEFNRLRQFRVNIKEFTAANDSANQFKNRLANALPYNDNRVYLTYVPGVNGSDYINASYIDGYSYKRAFIATQGPLKETVNDFWRMVAERDIHIIVMLTQLEEKGKEMCARSWPEETSATEDRGDLSIQLLSEEPFNDYIHRKIKLNETVKGTVASRVVHHFQFTAWPEYGAPEEGGGMIDLIGQVLRVQQQTGQKPIIVHCSAGIGRTGAFCALSSAIERVKAEGLIDVFHTVKHLRTQRPHMVQTLEQYIFCYRAISEYVNSLEQYANFV